MSDKNETDQSQNDDQSKQKPKGKPELPKPLDISIHTEAAKQKDPADLSGKPKKKDK